MKLFSFEFTLTSEGRGCNAVLISRKKNINLSMASTAVMGESERPKCISYILNMQAYKRTCPSHSAG